MSKLFSRRGWRCTATINVVLAFAFSISQSGASLAHPTIIFYGSCTTSSRLNLRLHLRSLTSGNQSRSYLLRSLDIGIPSIRNLSHVSRLKSASWLIFFITSIPIHLLFNSSVFETTYDESQWRLTFATESFTQGAPFFPPGASLSPAGSLGPTKFDVFGPTNGAYGETISIDQYWNASSTVRQKIASVAEESHSWTFLNTTQCHAEYVSCNPRNRYGDVLFILDSTASQGGWARSDVFTFDPSTDLSARWDPHIPPNAVNSLWFSTQCNTTRYKSLSGQEDDCRNTCLGAMGVDDYSFSLGERLPMAHEPWLITFFPAVRDHNKSLFDEGLEFNDKFNFLRVDHCLAHHIQPSCKVGLSNSLLLIVILSIGIKVIQGGVIIWKLSSESLVTPGDAIKSFMLYPDPATQGLGTLDIVDSQRIEFGMRKHWLDTLDSRYTTQVQPRRWKKSLRHLGNIIPNSTWVKSYSILFAGVVLLATGFGVASVQTRNNYSQSLDDSNGVLPLAIWLGQPPGYTATLLLANTPQLILSVCYFSYNSLLTQIHVEKEWNAFSLSYRPLRVSYPAGQQISTYRLQLPYRYSVPLILISAVLHWLVSNAVFLYINEGGYWISLGGLTGFSDAFSVSDRSLIEIGFSPLFFLLLFLASFSFIIFPPVFLGLFKIKGNMVAGGWNSLVVSAACHVPDILDGREEQPLANENDLYSRERTRTDDAEVSISPEGGEADFKRLLDLTRRKLRWGAMELSKRPAESILHEGGVLFYLGFGGEEHDISEPKDGHYYI
ncbi:hypothetical protein F4803DRAFT_569172 [Xylaria telfairii]|nr:hypothetical protein F4803DRAFT_569172 [Xylaria telfairii]